MDFKNIIETIEESKNFKDFIKKNPHYYLVHIFSTSDTENFGPWQIGYYSKDTDKIIVFEYDNEIISIHDPADALKKEEYIKKLDFDKLKISRENAIEIYAQVLEDNYSKENSNKVLLLLQNLPEFGNVWNITVITLSFSVINIKINAIDGKVLKHTKENLMNWKK